jgi:hypothetical protein
MECEMKIERLETEPRGKVLPRLDELEAELADIFAGLRS